MTDFFAISTTSFGLEYPLEVDKGLTSNGSEHALVRLHLTGRIVVETNGGVVLRERDFRARQERLLFAYLIANRRRTVSRPELRSVLWEDDHLVSAKTLNPLLARLRKLLSSDELATAGVAIDSRPSGIDVVLGDEPWVDLEAAAHHLDVAEGAIRAGRPKEGFGAAAVAAGITSRPFLADCHEQWAESMRERLRRQHLRALECLCQIWLASGEPHVAIEAASEALRLDAWRESALRLQMVAMKSTGETGAAVELYHAFRKRLSFELGMNPEAKTDEVFVGLLRQHS